MVKQSFCGSIGEITDAALKESLDRGIELLREWRNSAGLWLSRIDVSHPWSRWRNKALAITVKISLLWQ